MAFFSVIVFIAFVGVVLHYLMVESVRNLDEEKFGQLKGSKVRWHFVDDLFTTEIESTKGNTGLKMVLFL